LGCVRRVLQAEGWPARSWQQDGLLVEDEGSRRLRGGGGGDEAKARLEAAMRKAEAEVSCGRTYSHNREPYTDTLLSDTMAL
jgi:hypothetical protein